MDGNDFDQFVRKFATATSRRRFFKGLLGGGVAVAATTVAKTQPSLAAPQPKVDICHYDKSLATWFHLNVNGNAFDRSANAAHADDFLWGGCCTNADCSSLDTDCKVGVCEQGTRTTASQCVPQNSPDTTDCDLGLYCSVDDHCSSGACVSGGARDCSDGIACTGDSCDEENKVCVNAPNHTACDDENVCTDDYCRPGDEYAGEDGCVHENNTVSCDDNNDCTENDVCSEGACAGTEVDCGDCGRCGGGECQAMAGFTCANQCQSCLPSADETFNCQLVVGKVCNDGDACTPNDTCDAGGVCSGPRIDCGTCGQCVGGGCQAIEEFDCGEDQCLSCLENEDDTFTCQPDFGKLCNDGDACTPVDTCDGDGVCSGPRIVCDRVDDCTPVGICADGVCPSLSICTSPYVCCTPELLDPSCRKPASAACNGSDFHAANEECCSRICNSRDTGVPGPTQFVGTCS